MTAGASAGLPDLPADFWSTWPHSAGDANWTPIGPAQTIASLDPLRPDRVEWTWTPSADADPHTCLLVVVDSASDPIPAASKVFDIAALVTGEKHVGLKNLHIVDLLPDTFAPIPLSLYASAGRDDPYVLRLPAVDDADLSLGVLFSKATSRRLQAKPPRGLTSAKLSTADLARIKERWVADELGSEKSWRQVLRTYDVTRQFRVSRRSGYAEVALALKPGGVERILLLPKVATTRKRKPPTRVSFQQLTTGGEVVGGSTFVLRQAKG